MSFLQAPGERMRALSVPLQVITDEGKKASSSESTTYSTEQQQSLKRWQIAIFVIIMMANNLFNLIGILDPFANAIMADASIGIGGESQYATWGFILMAGNLANMIGGFLIGPITDILGGKMMFLASMLMTCGAAFGIAASPNAIVLGICWSIGFLAQAAPWVALTKLVMNWYRENQYASMFGWISALSRVGSTAAYAIIAFELVQGLKWRFIFVMHGIIGCVYAVTFLLMKEEPKLAGLPPIQAASGDGPAEEEDGGSFGHAMKRVLTSTRFWTMFVSISGLSCCFEVFSFTPVYFKEVFAIDDGAANLLFTVSASLGTTIALLCGPLYDKLPQKLNFFTMWLFCCAAFTSAGVIALTTPTTDGETISPSSGRGIVIIACIFILGFSFAPPFYITSSVFSCSLGGKWAATVSGVLTAFSNVANVAFDAIIPSLREKYGWVMFWRIAALFLLPAIPCMAYFFWRDITKGKKDLDKGAVIVPKVRARAATLPTRTVLPEDHVINDYHSMLYGSGRAAGLIHATAGWAVPATVLLSRH
eukprot:TRINITY_DN4572_c0_g1_i1.p1 TRINITY_DN4572_c0_g1~~TRINITY_DN4572_c0_g1_i1.p1  ORF type:complete len:536 (-),score=97.29 TRINITY_DN4572_c0_g1_i1:320-1927(-)